jgi:hypothetical protein
VLLKTTHWPFVALIFGYERWRLHWEQRGDKKSSALYVRGPNSPRTLRRPLSGKWLQRPLAASGTRHSPLVREARTARTPVMAPTKTRHNLEAAVENLKQQIEKISTIIAEGKTTNSDDN